ncbi:MAG TPA: EAL domain-containing response regulator [Burkholderiales bacterium]|nr:EAL domain-containing response regulator [Burkholderiales bacterium]
MSIRELTFLVAEDHEFQRKALVRMLQGLGAEVVLEAEDGRAALDLFADLTQPVDIIFLDLDMPHMDGMEFIRHVGESGVPVSLVLSSALDAALVSSVETMARSYGINLLGAVEKPVTPQKLAALLARHTRASPQKKRGAMEQMAVADIAAGMAAGQFEAFLQPKVLLSTAEVIGAESLVRWRHPERGLIPPGAFVPTIESNGMIDDLTWLMLDQSAALVSRWLKTGREYSLSVNLSLRSLETPSLAERITERVLAQGVDPKFIVLEVTETAAMTDVGRCLENLVRLRMKGFGLSIDDYGTGYSSMQQLARVPYTELKIDQSFVMGASSQPRLRVMLESSMQMAEKLGLQAVAEGVETRRDWNLLAELGCHKAQGYYIAKPMPAAEFLDWIDEWPPKD